MDTTLIWLTLRWLSKGLWHCSTSKTGWERRSYGLCDQISAWTLEFLSNRKQRVTLGQASSPCYPSLSGVPQGSVLGLLIPFYQWFTRNSPDSNWTFRRWCETLPRSQQRVWKSAVATRLKYTYTLVWPMAPNFNPAKCKITHFGYNNNKFNYTMTPNDEEVAPEKVEEEKDLGVFLTQHLSLVNML